MPKKTDTPIKNYKERHVYQYPCSRCGRRKSRSFKRRFAKLGLCRKCRTNNPNPNQIAMPFVETKLDMADKVLEEANHQQKNAWSSTTTA